MSSYYDDLFEPLPKVYRIQNNRVGDLGVIPKVHIQNAIYAVAEEVRKLRLASLGYTGSGRHTNRGSNRS